MLIEFTVSNYRSFREPQTLSMVASAISERSEANTFDAKLPGFGRFLRSAVVYGPNAAGKTNLLRALRFMKTVVLASTATATTAPARHDPFKLSPSTRGAPSEFQATFVEEGVRYEYGFSLDAEQFQTEWLVEYAHARGREIFRRQYNKSTGEYDWKYSKYLKGRIATWSASTHKNALFLSTAVSLNSAQLVPVFNWFRNRLQVIVSELTLNQTLTVKMLADPKGKEKLLPFLKEADLGISDFEVTRERLPGNAQGVMVRGGGMPMVEQSQEALHLVKVSFTHVTTEKGGGAALDFEEESNGTQAFFKNAGAWLNVLDKGEVLLIDEIDSSLHPILTKYLVEKFHSAETNPKNAQLIFNTHSTTLLDLEILRRDQVWFIEKDQRGASRLYALSDFKPRKDEAIERWYMRGRYGALPLPGGAQD